MKALFSQRVLLPEGIRKAAFVVIEDGKIIDIKEYFDGEIEDLGDLLLSPGVVDTHVHINEPGRTDWEGFRTATQAAAAGGTTTLVDMPLNCLPVTTSKKNLGTKLTALQGQLAVDCGFWGGVTPESLPDLEELLNSGVLGVKSFLIDSGIEEFPEMKEKDLDKAVSLLAESGLPYLIHAEIDGGEDVPINDDYNSFLHSRPAGWENKAIELMIKYARKTHCHVHIVHLSSAEALPLLQEARKKDVNITVETCPHYLLFSAEEIGKNQTLFKCCPPIREKSNQDLLWQGLLDGTIDFICSDHSPCTAGLKAGDFGQAWGGISSLQFSLPLIWTEMESRGLSLEQLTRWMSERPATFAGLGQLKGKIAPGFDADLIAWSPEEEFTISREEILFKNKFTPYEGKKVKGRIYHTFLRGEKVFENGKISDHRRGQTLLRGISI